MWGGGGESCRLFSLVVHFASKELSVENTAFSLMNIVQ